DPHSPPLGDPRRIHSGISKNNIARRAEDNHIESVYTRLYGRLARARRRASRAFWTRADSRRRRWSLAPIRGTRNAEDQRGLISTFLKLDARARNRLIQFSRLRAAGFEITGDPPTISPPNVSQANRPC